MRPILRSMALVGGLAIGGVVGAGTSSARAQGYADPAPFYTYPAQGYLGAAQGYAGPARGYFPLGGYSSYGYSDPDGIVLEAGRQLAAQRVYTEQMQGQRDAAVEQAAAGRAEAERRRWERDVERAQGLQERAALSGALEQQMRRDREDAFRRAMQYEALMRTRP